MNDSKVAVPLDAELVHEAVEAGIDVAAVSQQAIRRALQASPERLTPEDKARRQEDARREIAIEIEGYNQHVQEHGLFADAWRTF